MRWPHAWDGVHGYDRAYQTLCRVIIGIILLTAFAFGGIVQPEARAEYWADLLAGECPDGTEYRGYTATGRCRCNTSWRAANRRYVSDTGDGTPGWVSCSSCSSCSPGGFVTICENGSDYPRPVCVEEPATADEEEDEERVADLDDGFGGGAGDLITPGNALVNPLAPLLDLFGADVGEVRLDDVVPQAGNEDDGYSCPAGTTEITDPEADGYGQCSITDRCVFYGAAGGTYPDCECSREGTVFARIGFWWDPHALRCQPREEAYNADGPSALRYGSPTGSPTSSWIGDRICETDLSATGRSRGYTRMRDYATQTVPEFTVRRGGVDYQARGGTTITLTELDDDDSDYWFGTASDEEEATEFGSVLCSYLRPWLARAESTFMGRTISANARCPTLTLPFFGREVSVDAHCYLVGRWLGVIQAAFVFGYLMMGTRTAFRWVFV